MIACLYICDQSFMYNGSDSDMEVARKLFDFKQMVDEARQYDDNVFYLNRMQFLETIILQGKVTIGDIVNKRDMRIGRDCMNLFLSLFNICKSCSLSKEEMVAYLTLEDESLCHAMLVLNPQKDLPENHQVISTVAGWMKFRRFYLGKYPQSADFFLSEVKKYFKKLCIHEQNKCRYLREILDTHSRRLVEYLTALNDNFLDEYNKFSGDLVQFLPVFSKAHCIDGASFEGNKDEKFKCVFSLEGGDIFEAYCEPHLKMYADDSGNRNQHGRIYFRAPQKTDEKIYIGFICQHL